MEAGIGIRLHQAGITSQMLFGMHAGTIARLN
jgi:hypothetical protein